MNFDENYHEDILGQGFEARVFHQPDDYEGKVVTTLIRKHGPEKSLSAVLYVHGFNDYFFQTEMAERYIQEGYNFYAVDLRKYGRSFLPGQKMNNVRDLSEYDEDIDLALEQIREEGNEYIILSGHSTGGLIISLYAAKKSGKGSFNAVFLNSPFWDMNMGLTEKWVGIPLISCLGKYWPDIRIPGGFSPLYGLSLHKDFYGEWDYRLDWKPHIAPNVNSGWIRAIHKKKKKVKRGLSISEPLLVIHSMKSIYEKKWSSVMFTGDAVLNVKDMEKQGARIKGDCRMVAIQSALHDVVLSKKEVRENVYQELFSWLGAFRGRFTIG